MKLPGLLSACLSLALGVAPAFASPPASSNGHSLNPAFVDADGDGFPDGWSPSPGGDGSLRRLAPRPDGGLLFRDGDKIRALGIEQWIPVQEDAFYTAYVEFSGEGSVNLLLGFSSELPSDAIDARQPQLAGKSIRAEPGRVTELVAKAPSGARWARLCLHSSKGSVADLLVHTAGLRAASRPLPATSSTELRLNLDFETGDTSQIRAAAPDPEVAVTHLTSGPVREGHFAARIALPRGRARGEITVLRAPPAGLMRHEWSLYLPAEFDTRPTAGLARWDDKGAGRDFPGDDSGPTALLVQDGRYVFRLRHQSETTAAAETRVWNLAPVEADLGRWTDWVLEVNWQAPGQGGWLRLFKDGQLVLSHQGTTYFTDKSSGPLFKVGLDRGTGKWRGDPSGSILYVDAIHIQQGAPAATTPPPSSP